MLRPNLLLEPFLNLLIRLPGPPLREHPEEPLLIDLALGIEHPREPCPFVSCPDIHARRGDRLLPLGSAVFLVCASSDSISARICSHRWSRLVPGAGSASAR